jgi:hypothetical protein
MRSARQPKAFAQQVVIDQPFHRVLHRPGLRVCVHMRVRACVGV